MFSNVYSGKKILVTGHTGFKGSWLTSWLLKLDAQVCGVSKDVPTNPSMFVELELEKSIQHFICDIQDYNSLQKIVSNFQPDFVFHLAAQAIVSESYDEPLATISTNVIGTANILEALRNLTKPCVAVIITSDKCYENVEWEWGYKETDHVGGKDIYSGSKGAAEIIFHAYKESFFSDSNQNIMMASARAGNVIGGGDWARDRIVVDCFESWAKGRSVEIRSPNATRPWQHVLEPISGYLTLGESLTRNSYLHGHSFNFGPKSEKNKTVLELLNDLSSYWGFESNKDGFIVTDNIPFHEAGLLKLNCDKALFHLNWEGTLFYNECVKLVGEWYFGYYNGNVNIHDLTMLQIMKYEELAKERGLEWAIE